MNIEKQEETALMRILSNTDKPVVGRRLASMLNTYLASSDYEDVQVREIVKRLRDRGEPIVAGSNGYKLTHDADELLAQAESLRDRGKSMIDTATSLYNASLKMRKAGF